MQPYIIKFYNEGMNGWHRLLESYEQKFHIKKWYWNIFIEAVNVTEVAGMILPTNLHKDSSLEMTYLNFRREILTLQALIP